jgi:hypothetical protein
MIKLLIGIKLGMLLGWKVAQPQWLKDAEQKIVYKIKGKS